MNESNEDMEAVRVEDEAILVRDLKRLEPSRWLNGDIINTYRHLLSKRSTEVHIFSTYFHAELSPRKWNKHHIKVCAPITPIPNPLMWLKDVDLSRFRKLFIPMHMDQSHWCLAVVQMQHRSVAIYDSLYQKLSSKLRKVILPIAFLYIC
jgi:sentrin-specific protease 1